MKFLTLNKKGFTFVELIIGVTILAIVSTIALVSFTSNLSDGRDTQRKSDLEKITAALTLYKQERGFYPLPGDSFNITNSGTTVAIQGKINTDVYLSTLKDIPKDPYTKTHYTYSISKNRQEFQLVATLENDDEPKSIVVGDYKTVSENVLPSLLVINETNNDIEIHDGIGNGSLNRDFFLFNDSQENLIYSLDGDYGAQTGTLDFTGSLEKAKTKIFLQDTRHYSCAEIFDAGKSIGPGEYQIQNASGDLVNIYCSMDFSVDVTCMFGEHSDGFSCIPDTRSCPIQNGTGQETWNYGSSSWGTCLVVTCNTNYGQVGNICMNICMAGGMTPCVIQ